MAIKGAKTFAEGGIRMWLMDHGYDVGSFKIQFTSARDAVVMDENGDSISLAYDKAAKEVYVVE